MRDTYKILTNAGHAEIKIKGSRFIGEAIPVQDAAQAEAQIKRVRKREYAATHHCTAYRVGIEGDVFRYNDDGEPNGTAGQPILRQVDARDLTNSLVVVTRYYGGTKLGTGGLIRAYGESASLALDASTVEECIVRIPVRIVYRYEDTSPAMHTLAQYDTKIIETNYSEQTEMILAVRRSEAVPFSAAFVQALSGRGTVTLLDTSGQKKK